MSEAHQATMPVLACKTPQCPQARTVVLEGPTPTALQGHPALQVQWWCGSCGALWRSVARTEVVAE